MARKRKKQARAKTRKSAPKKPSIAKCARVCWKEYEPSTKGYPEEAKEMKAYCKSKCKATKGKFTVPPMQVIPTATAAPAKKRSFFSRLFRRS